MLQQQQNLFTKTRPTTSLHSFQEVLKIITNHREVDVVLKMFKPRPCGCKGVRTCLICEADQCIEKVKTEPDTEALQDSLEFCHLCVDKAWQGVEVWKQHPDHSSQGYHFPGVYLQPDFLSEEEEKELVSACDSMRWDLSQSGRRKQNFGPKTNFKRKKISGKSFQGFPPFSLKFQDKLNQVPILHDFITIEQCAIEYRPETGASIDPHIDDCWVWGERVISLSLLSSSTLTMTKYQGPSSKYNLEHHLNNTRDSPSSPNVSKDQYPIVRIPMPPRSLLVLYGPARYEWEHAILRKDISSRRICMAYREFTPDYLPGGCHYQQYGNDIILKAKQICEPPK